MKIVTPSVQPKAFSLMEMLISLAGIAILSVILFAVSSQLSHKTKAAQCAHHLRQIWTALCLYANDHQGKLPGPSYHGVTVSAPSVPMQLLPYTGHSDAIWDCPARPRLRTLRGYTGYLQGTYYEVGFGTHLAFGYPAGTYPEKKSATLRWISQLPNPDLFWLLTDLDAQNYNTPGLAELAPGPAHQGARNVLYHDGRVVLQSATP